MLWCIKAQALAPTSVHEEKLPCKSLSRYWNPQQVGLLRQLLHKRMNILNILVLQHQHLRVGIKNSSSGIVHNVVRYFFNTFLMIIDILPVVVEAVDEVDAIWAFEDVRNAHDVIVQLAQTEELSKTLSSTEAAFIDKLEWDAGVRGWLNHIHPQIFGTQRRGAHDCILRAGIGAWLLHNRHIVRSIRNEFDRLMIKLVREELVGWGETIRGGLGDDSFSNLLLNPSLSTLS